MTEPRMALSWLGNSALSGHGAGLRFLAMNQGASTSPNTIITGSITLKAQISAIERDTFCRGKMVALQPKLKCCTAINCCTIPSL